jgi:hypothetical protein
MDYYGTPENYPKSLTVKQVDASGKEYTEAYARYDDNYLYIPNFTGKGLFYLKIDKHCIMDAIKHWESLEEGEING